MPTRRGSFHLFKLFGIDVYLHWSWFLVAIIELQIRRGLYSSITWNILEYLTLFLIVLTHEFGHSLACRSVGGQANQIVLWPLGGVAYVSPPQRPGAVLWSIVAGPLVNVVLVPILSLLWWYASSAGWEETVSDVYVYIVTIWKINLLLLAFNILPIYPLDGGKILYALLWFIVGQARGLMAACIIGFIGVGGLLVLTIWLFTISPRSAIWYTAICIFILLNCYQGFKSARELLRIAKAPRREGFHCPECKAVPPSGDLWLCGKCRKKFDTFASQGTCPHCGTAYARTACSECGAAHPITEWMDTPPAPPPLPAASPPPA
ncbi:MAG TPA: site-2 protease family protein [Candidatus Acidoferrales bacterium]|jgi:Zn-dependent protease|nr:site-2 protease family protein [Candidatus Acidoferrales bacterium]